jgi:ankyrin repeat protein
LLLATNGMVVNLKDNKDLAPLFVAARDGNEAAAKLLLAREGDIAWSGREGP